ncbi:hypothetical protein O181_075853 [Austropuccinia psidii MF-1]|uniref:Uncharacterized protein n=1 Tax=Austropuccinia psidii MF-1 TaxID=1389203 RepID=A0A9Q3IC93_9BASI|nr:hypothetical protein [Austropuccinia psidii MF-1]
MGRERVNHLKENLLAIHPTAQDFHDRWKRACDTEARCIAEAKEYNKQSYDKTHKEPDFKQGYQVLVSSLNFNNLNGPRKMRDQFLGLFTINRLMGKNSGLVQVTEQFSRKHQVFQVSLVKPLHQSGEDTLHSRKKD